MVRNPIHHSFLRPIRVPALVALVALALAPAAATVTAAQTLEAKAPAAPTVQEVIDGLAPRYRDWVIAVAGLLTRGELDYFAALSEDYQRDAFMEAFWEPRDPEPLTPRNELRDRWQQAIDSFGGVPSADPRFMLYLLNGPPGGYSLPDGRPMARCFSRSRDLEIWFYGSSERLAREFLVIIYRRSAGDDWRVYLPGDSLNPSRRFGRLPTTNVRELCDDAVVRWAAREVSRQGSYASLIEKALTPPLPPVEWLANLRLSGTEPPSGAGTLALDATIDHPARRQSRTAVRALLQVPVSEAPGRAFDGKAFHHFEVNGEVIRDGELFERFRYRFEGPTPDDAGVIPLGFTRYLRPGPLTLRLLVHDVFGDQYAQIVRDVEVPKPDGLAEDPGASLEAMLAGDRAPAGPAAAGGSSLRLDAPPRGPLAGLVRFTARSQGGLDKVAFYLDGRPIFTLRRPPWSVELDLGPEPAPHRVRVVGLRGEREVATDQIWLNQGAARFRVSLIEPRSGGIYPGSLTARVEVETPGGERPERIEIWRDEERVATLSEPPLEATVELEGSAPAVVRAIAYLADGSSAEDAVLVNAAAAAETVEVRLVEVPVLVVGADGEPIRDLTAADFRVLDEGEPRPIERLLTADELPLQVGILIDRSVSMEPILAPVAVAASRFARAIVTARQAPANRAAVFSFADRLTVDADLTTGAAELERAFAGLVARGGTRLYDGVAAAVTRFGNEPGQRALVLFSDGADEGSVIDLAGAIGAAGRQRAAIFVIAPAAAFEDRAKRRELERLAEETGGRTWLLEDLDRLDSIYDRIAELVRARYLLTFTAPGDAGEGPRRLEIAVERAGARVEAQSTYSPNAAGGG